MLSFANTRELNGIIDCQLTTRRPRFQREEISLGGETYELFHRDPLECLRALWGSREFSEYLIYAPERHYLDESCDSRLYHDMHTGDWWWQTQVCPHT